MIKIIKTWNSGHQITHSPPQSEHVCGRDVDADRVAEAVAEVDAPVEDAGGGAALVVAEEVRNQADADWTASGLSKI